MASSKIFLALVVILTTKDEAFSCPTRSHKAGSYPCKSSLSDSTSNLHHSSATKIPCNTASGSSSSSSSLSSRLTLPSKTPLTPDLLPTPAAPFLQTTSHVYSNSYSDLLNILTKMLSSYPSNVTWPQIPLATQLTLPNLPVSNIVRGPVKIPKPHITHSSHVTLPGSGPCPSGSLPGLPNGLVPPSIAIPSPNFEFPFTDPTLNVTSYSNMSGENTEPSNVLQKPSPLNTPKLIPLSRLCAQFSPASNTSSTPVLDSTSLNKSLSDPSQQSDDRSPSTSPGGLRPSDASSYSSSSSSNTTTPEVPGAVLPGSPVGELTPALGAPAPAFTSVPTSTVPTTEPTPASDSSTVCGGRKPSAVVSVFHRKRPSSTPAPRTRPSDLSPPPPPLPCLKNQKATSASRPVPGVAGVKPAHKGPSPGCVTSSGPLPRPIAIPTPSAVSSGYNPAFMQLLVDRLVSDPNSPLSSSLPRVRPPSDTTSHACRPPPSRNDAFQTSALNGPLCRTNANALNAPPDKPVGPTPTPGSNSTTALCNNPAFTNILCKLLVSSLGTSKTHFPPCSPLSNITSLFNTTSMSSV